MLVSQHHHHQHHTHLHYQHRRNHVILVATTLFLVAASLLSPVNEWVTGNLGLNAEAWSSTSRAILPLHTAISTADSARGNFYVEPSFSLGDELLGIQPRAFRPWRRRSNSAPLPCFPAEQDWKTVQVQNTPSPTGFLYMKPYKTGSSTASGVNLRIARNVANRQRAQLLLQKQPIIRNQKNATTTTMCRARFGHGPQPFPAHSLFRNRSLAQSFLWTIIREPSKRMVSEFFHFQVSRRRVDPTDSNFESFLFSTNGHVAKNQNNNNKKKKNHSRNDTAAVVPNHRRDYYLSSLHVAKKFHRSRHDPIQTANAILDEYNFIGITERMDESVVVLKMLLDIPMADVLFITAKQHGGYDDGGGGYGKKKNNKNKQKNNNIKCTYIWPSFVSTGMQQALDSDAWQDAVRYDRAFYLAANRSLDMTIDRVLGRTKFQTQLDRFLTAKQVIAKRCWSQAHFPCREDGIRRPDHETDCLWKDSGCATTCLDQVATDLGLWDD